MAGDVQKERAIAVSQQEISRQFRLVKQIVAMHHALHDRFQLKSTIAKISLLAAAVVFLTTAFAGADVYQSFRLTQELTMLTLDVASSVAFFFSLVLLIVDWPGSSARHQDAATQWSATLKLFRDRRLEDGTWPPEELGTLTAAYSESVKYSVAIPDKQFNALKIKYLTKVEISRLAEQSPGAPKFILWLIVRFSGAYTALRRVNGGDQN